MVVKQLDNWPVYKVQCLPTGNQHNPTYWILHRNHLMLVPSKDDTASDTTQLLASEEEAAPESVTLSLLTRQGGGPIPHVWLNGKFHTQLYTQMESKVVESQPESIVDSL